MSAIEINSKDFLKFKRIGIALSGGLDSSVLLNIMANEPMLKDRITALHVNHNINTDADRWEEFCSEQSRKLGIPFQSLKLNKTDNPSEDYLRSKRQEFFRQWGGDQDLIVTAHHLDDQVETILFRIFRGTGIKGIKGINQFSTIDGVNFFRPFLDIKKHDLKEYALKNNIPWVEDDSNEESNFSRNKIRNLILPSIRETWSSIDKAMIKLSKDADKSKQILDEIAQDDYSSTFSTHGLIKLARINALSKPRKENLIYYWLVNINGLKANFAQIDQIYTYLDRELVGPASFHFKTIEGESDVQIIINSKEIRIMKDDHKTKLPKDLNLEWNLKDNIKISSGELSVVESLGKGLSTRYLKEGAIIRARVGGERCKPYGRKKSQKIKNLFQEYDIPDWKREQIPLIYINDKIAAVGDLWVCEDFHTPAAEKGLSIVWKEIES